MKLCKDCKHARFPHPMDEWLGVKYYAPMCAHPDMPTCVVRGELLVTCIVARGQCCGGPTKDSICGMEAELFEQRPPEVALDHGADFNRYATMRQVRTSRGAQAAKPWWRRMFGG